MSSSRPSRGSASQARGRAWAVLVPGSGGGRDARVAQSSPATTPAANRKRPALSTPPKEHSKNDKGDEGDEGDDDDDDGDDEDDDWRRVENEDDDDDDDNNGENEDDDDEDDDDGDKSDEPASLLVIALLLALAPCVRRVLISSRRAISCSFVAGAHGCGRRAAKCKQEEQSDTKRRRCSR
jgi:hypothetical protein